MDKDKKRATARAYYLAHYEEMKAKGRTYYETHREQKRAYGLAHREERNVYERAYRQSHRQQMRKRYRTYHQALIAEALRVLGYKCACPGCGVSEPAFLTIDHIHGLTNRRGNALKEAKASGWDKTKFQILCYNCNCAKHDRGFCPVHQKASGNNGHKADVSPQLALSIIK